MSRLVMAVRRNSIRKIMTTFCYLFFVSLVSRKCKIREVQLNLVCCSVTWQLIQQSESVVKQENFTKFSPGLQAISNPSDSMFKRKINEQQRLQFRHSRLL